MRSQKRSKKVVQSEKRAKKVVRFVCHLVGIGAQICGSFFVISLWVEGTPCFCLRTAFRILINELSLICIICDVGQALARVFGGSGPKLNLMGQVVSVRLLGRQMNGIAQTCVRASEYIRSRKESTLKKIF
ncbi:hypothetical protein H6P81_004395 [Aristolochia fimbriata]|uniref:Uncharacterized protein n=1 Tax=Aristolochia fimbriata TaxID=158543 RepID=A0AAV7FI05_ARIFI|nr:hypothetical protein H6P81_004395 [Aristolochia fimbriata]